MMLIWGVENIPKRKIHLRILQMKWMNEKKMVVDRTYHAIHILLWLMYCNVTLSFFFCIFFYFFFGFPNLKAFYTFVVTRSLKAREFPLRSALLQCKIFFLFFPNTYRYLYNFSVCHTHVRTYIFMYKYNWRTNMCGFIYYTKWNFYFS